jgi:pyrroloquinoline quinone biosynthesis protein E
MIQDADKNRSSASLDDYEIADGVLWRDTPDMCIIYRRDHGGYYLLEGVGQEVWSMLSNKQSSGDIVRSISTRYGESPDRVEDDLRDLVLTLLDEGLITCDHPCAPPMQTGDEQRATRSSLSEITPGEILKRISDKMIPAQGHLDITYRCNETCCHCQCQDVSGNASVRDEMSTLEILRCLDMLAEVGCIELGITGGEPALREDLEDVAEHMWQLGFVTTLFTNGIALPPHRIARLAPNLTTTVEAIRRFAEHDLLTMAQMPLLSNNCDSVDATRALALECGASFNFGITVCPTLLGNMSPLKHRMDEAQLRSLVRKCWGGTLGEENRSVLRPLTGRRLAGERPCGAGFRIFNIRPDGSVDPCGKLPLRLGNVRTEHFRDIWFGGEAVQELRKSLMAGMDGWVCHSCELFNVCAFTCVGIAGTETGDLWKAPASRCWFAHILRSMDGSDEGPN